MRIKFYFSVIIFFYGCIIFGQNLPGARQIALSNSDVALSDDVFSVFNNPAGLSQFNWREIGIYYSPAPFGLSALANGYAAYHEPIGSGAVTAGFMTYGFELYKETKIALSYSYNLKNKFFAGVTAIYHNLKIQNYGSGNSFSFNLGGLAYITNHLRMGFVIHNISRATFGKEENQIPMILNIGASYDLTNNFSFNAAIEKDIDFTAAIHFGAEYSIIKYVTLRIGFSNEPNTLSGGIGINYSLFQIDYAVFTHQDLGLTHQAGIIIHFSSFDSRNSAIRKYLNK